MLQLFLLLFFTSLIPPQEQLLTYAVLLRNDKIGELHVKRSLQRGTIDYNLESTIKVEKIITVLVEYRMLAHFENGILQRSSIWQKSNKRVNVNSTTTRTAEGYLIEKLNGKRKISEIIDFNLCTLYFQEPLDRKKIWSDSYGEFIGVRSVGPHRYELLLPDGKKNYYTYHYGICTLVETEQLFSKISFRLIPTK